MSAYSKHYVIFTDDSGHWWSRFLKPGIRHCYVVKPDRDRLLVLCRSTMEYEAYTTKLEDIDKNGIIISCKAKPARRWLLCVNTCVGYTKQILGINKPFIWTPYQLYKYLKVTNEKAKSP